MPWWGWVAVGVILLGSELAWIDAQFYMIFVGSAALIIGVLAIAGVPLAGWAQWLLFGALSIFALIFFRKRLYSRLRRALPEMHSGPIGDVIVASSALAPGQSGRLEYRGSHWTVYNEGEFIIDVGAHARIVGIDGVTLRIRKF